MMLTTKMLVDVTFYSLVPKDECRGTVSDMIVLYRDAIADQIDDKAAAACVKKPKLSKPAKRIPEHLQAMKHLLR